MIPAELRYATAEIFLPNILSSDHQEKKITYCNHGMLLRRAQRQCQRVHAALLRRTEFGGQRGMHGTRAGHSADACESIALTSRTL